MERTQSVPPDIQGLLEQLDAAEADARALTGGLTEAQGAWRPQPGAWSIAECLEHLGTSNDVYLLPMREAAARARRRHALRRGPAVPGILGGLFVRSMGPRQASSPRFRSPHQIAPRPSPGLVDAFEHFVSSQGRVRGFLSEFWDLDLVGTRFANPFVRGLGWSLATGLHVITAHERRHLRQARTVQQALAASELERARALPS
jgi:hypothetical protein